MTELASTTSKVDARDLYFSPHRVLDFRIMNLDLDPLFERPIGASKYNHYLKSNESKMKMTGTVIMQLGEFEPVQFHFRGYPLETPTAGIICLLPKKEDRMNSQQQILQYSENNVNNDEKQVDFETSFLKGPGNASLVFSFSHVFTLLSNKIYSMSL